MDIKIHTDKKPGDLVLAENGRLLRVGKDMRQYPYEQPRRREQRLRAERARQRLADLFAGGSR